MTHEVFLLKPNEKHGQLLFLMNLTCQKRVLLFVLRNPSTFHFWHIHGYVVITALYHFTCELYCHAQRTTSLCKMFLQSIMVINHGKHPIYLFFFKKWRTDCLLLHFYGCLVRESVCNRCLFQLHILLNIALKTLNSAYVCCFSFIKYSKENTFTKGQVNFT